jgi:integrase
MSRKPSHICVLTDGRRVRYSLQERGGFYNVCFRGPDGRRKFLTTKERTAKRADDAACVVIRQEYEPKSSTQKVAWDEALAVAEKAMKEQNLRERSIRAYLDQIKRVRTVFPSSKGPAEITPAKAKQFKAALVEKKLAPYTISTCLRDLTSIWNKWFIGECKLLDANPWEEIERPELDEPEPRYIEPQEEQAFHDWLLKRWDGWRLPVLFFRVKSLVGRRILQLASLPSDRLDEEGRLFFSSRNVKNRHFDYARLPADLAKELQAIAGPTYLWERYVADLRAIHARRKTKNHATCVKTFDPKRLKRWLQQQIADYCQENKDVPGFRPFTAHNFRDTAMTRAWDADIPVDKAAIAFGCNAETMKRHYIRKEKIAITDAVFDQIRPGGTANNGPGDTANKLLTNSSETPGNQPDSAELNGNADSPQEPTGQGE